MVQGDDHGKKYACLHVAVFPVEILAERILTLQFLWLQTLGNQHFMLDTGVTIQHTPALTQ